MVFYRVVACGSMRSQRLFKINWKLKTENSPQSTLKIVEEDDETKCGEVGQEARRTTSRTGRQLGTNERRSCCYCYCDCCCYCLHAAAAGRECEREQWMGEEWGGVGGVIKESETQSQSLSSAFCSRPTVLLSLPLSLSLRSLLIISFSPLSSPHSLWQRDLHTYEWDLCLDFSVTFWSTFPNPKTKRRSSSSRSKRSETERNESRRNERRETIEEREEPNEVSGGIIRQWRRSKKRIVGDFPCPTSASKSGLRIQLKRAYAALPQRINQAH